MNILVGLRCGHGSSLRLLSRTLGGNAASLPPPSILVVGVRGALAPRREMAMEMLRLRAARLIITPSQTSVPGALPPDPRDEDRAGKVEALIVRGVYLISPSRL